jgi:predicted GNAT family acetyltransferase
MQPSGAGVIDVPELARFELRADDDTLGWIDYRPAGESIIIAHTEIAPENDGRGLGGVLVRGAIERIVAAGKTVVPTCPFAAAYIRRHPELEDAVAPWARG